MSNDQVRGKVLRFTFNDGPMAGKAFDHAFAMNGTVTFRAAGDDTAKAEPAKPVAYEAASLRDDICALSYRSAAGYTLTVVLDFASGELVAFSSSDKLLGVQRGTVEDLTGTNAAPARSGGRRTDTLVSASRH